MNETFTARNVGGYMPLVIVSEVYGKNVMRQVTKVLYTISWVAEQYTMLHQMN